MIFGPDPDRNVQIPIWIPIAPQRVRATMIRAQAPCAGEAVFSAAGPAAALALRRAYGSAMHRSSGQVCVQLSPKVKKPNLGI